MNGQSSTIEWRILLKSSPASVYELLSTEAGRARFWAESAPEEKGEIFFVFPNGERLTSRVLEREPQKLYALTYFGGSRVEFRLESVETGGCVLTLRESGVRPSEASQNRAGWVSVLLSLKACADFNIDLRNHDPSRNWDEGYVDN